MDSWQRLPARSGSHRYGSMQRNSQEEHGVVPIRIIRALLWPGEACAGELQLFGQEYGYTKSDIPFR